MRGRDVMLGAVLFAGLLDFSANWLAAHYLVPVGFGLLVLTSRRAHPARGPRLVPGVSSAR